VILNIKYFITISLVLFGFYFFYKEYDIILKLDLIDLKFEDIKREPIIIDKVTYSDTQKNEKNFQKKESLLIQKQRIILKGDAPSLLNVGKNCKFCSRFDESDCACGGTKINQNLIEFKKGHYVRCHKNLLAQN